jgi:hypothetical protein
VDQQQSNGAGELDTEWDAKQNKLNVLFYSFF